jgi:hypothetical protein
VNARATAYFALFVCSLLLAVFAPSLFASDHLFILSFIDSVIRPPFLSWGFISFFWRGGFWHWDFLSFLYIQHFFFLFLLTWYFDQLFLLHYSEYVFGNFNFRHLFRLHYSEHVFLGLDMKLRNTVVMALLRLQLTHNTLGIGVQVCPRDFSLAFRSFSFFLLTRHTPSFSLSLLPSARPCFPH